MTLRTHKILGIILIVSGIALILNSFSGITGFFIVEDINKDFGSFLGLILLLQGIFLYLVGAREAEKEKGLVEIVKTRKFKKAIKGAPKKLIDLAIAKIGTGLANEERLKYVKGRKSIRTSKGGRIIYRQQKGTIVLEDYFSDHQYA
ncbi:MAG: hypothetical protein KKF68_00810 [Nanoarchaeota archaeon]|nr:hypothetical protein [Nanoarchaeota archaeon]